MSNSPASISEVIKLPEDTWLNDGLTGVIREIEEKVAKKSGRKFWVLKMADPKTNEVVEAACFTYPNVQSGQQVDVVGKGIKRKDAGYGIVKVSWGEDASIHVIGTNIAHETGAAAAANGDTMPKGNFHTQMKREALLMTHCIYYAAKVVEKVGASGMQDLAKGLNSPEHIRALAAGLMIRAEKLGLSSIVPALGTAENGHANHAPANGAPARSYAPTPATRPSEVTERQAANLDDRPAREMQTDDIPF